MATSERPMVRYIEVCVTPFTQAREAQPHLHTVQITVRTPRERVCLRETIPDSDFIMRFEWMMKRITKEVIERSGCCES